MQLGDEVDRFVQGEAGLFVPLVPIDPSVNQMTYAPRKLKTKWSMATDFSDWQLFSGGPQYPDNSVDILNDALEDPNYDPEKP